MDKDLNIEGVENMLDTKKTNAVILENDPELAKTVQKLLEKRGFAVSTLTGKQEIINEIKRYALAIVGNVQGSHSVFETMREIVMNSPMTSIILITDVPEKEVEDKAEGYGILGHVNTYVKDSQLNRLIDQYESIMNPEVKHTS